MEMECGCPRGKGIKNKVVKPYIYTSFQSQGHVKQNLTACLYTGPKGDYQLLAKQPQSVKSLSLCLVSEIIEHLFMIKICDLEKKREKVT